MKLIRHTRVSCVLSINIITHDKRGLHFSMMPLLSLSAALLTFYSLAIRLDRMKADLSRLTEYCLNLCEVFYEANNEIVRQLQDGLCSVFERVVYA